jgi:hypothetical protein
MTRDRHCECVRGTGIGDGPDSLGDVDSVGDLRVGLGRADGDLGERLPDTQLERCTADIEQRCCSDPRVVDKPDYLCDELLERTIGADDVGVRQASFEIVGQLLRIVAEEDGADAPLRGGDQDRAERARTER